MKLYEIIKALRGAQGSKAKAAILHEHGSNELLVAYLKAVYDPAINYYMDAKKLPKITPGDQEFSWNHLEGLLAITSRLYTGKLATEYMIGFMSALDTEGQELVYYIFKRSIEGGVGETLVLDAFPGLFFVPPYMRCAGMDETALEMYSAMPYFYVQTKMDGQFAYLWKGNNGASRLFSRNGSFYPPAIADGLAGGVTVSSVVMGELLVMRKGIILDRKTGNGILNSVLSGDGKKPLLPTDEIIMVAWDVVQEDEFLHAYSPTPYEKRIATLANMIHRGARNISLVQHDVVRDVSTGYALNKAAIALGQEGTVWKNPEGVWRNTSSGTRDAIKMKVVFEAEYRVKGKYEGEGKYAGMLGGFTYATECGEIAGNVGSGFDDDQRKEFWEADTDDWIIGIEANDVIKKKGRLTESLFLPIFVERRVDKTVADDRKRVLEQLQQAKSNGG